MDKPNLSFQKPFKELTIQTLETELADFSLWHKPYEIEMASRNRGVGLDSANHFERISFLDELSYLELVPQFGNVGKKRFKLLDEIMVLYSEIDKPCSMLIKDFDELQKHMLVAFQVSYSNYILGKRYDTKFPSNWCGVSSRNVMLSLMMFGYPNAAVGQNDTYKHCIGLLPFNMEKPHINGVIVIDPTSDQLWWERRGSGPRNLVFAIFGNRFRYTSDWRNGMDLFPETVLDLSILKQYIQGLALGSIDDSRYHHQNATNYLKESFSNPININGFCTALS